MRDEAGGWVSPCSAVSCRQAIGLLRTAPAKQVNTAGSGVLPPPWAALSADPPSWLHFASSLPPFPCPENPAAFPGACGPTLLPASVQHPFTRYRRHICDRIGPTQVICVSPTGNIWIPPWVVNQDVPGWNMWNPQSTFPAKAPLKRKEMVGVR